MIRPVSVISLNLVLRILSFVLPFISCNEVRMTSKVFTTPRTVASLMLSCDPDHHISVVSTSFGVLPANCDNNTVSCKVTSDDHGLQSTDCSGKHECMANVTVPTLDDCLRSILVTVFYNCSNGIVPHGTIHKETAQEECNKQDIIYLAVIGAMCGVITILFIISICLAVNMKRLKQRLSELKAARVQSSPNDYERIGDIQGIHGGYLTAAGALHQTEF